MGVQVTVWKNGLEDVIEQIEVDDEAAGLEMLREIGERPIRTPDMCARLYDEEGRTAAILHVYDEDRWLVEAIPEGDRW